MGFRHRRPPLSGTADARNVAEKVNLPRPVHHEQRHLSIPQIEALATECGYPSTFSRHRPLGERGCETYRLGVLFLAYTGVRFARWPRYGTDAWTRHAGAR